MKRGVKRTKFHQGSVAKSRPLGPVTRQRQSRERLESPLEFFANTFDTVREPLLLLDLDLRVVMANRSFYEVFKVTPQETEGQLIFNLGNGQWDIPALRELLERILPENTVFNNFEVKHRFENIGERTMVLNARKLFHGGEMIFLAIEDVTERKQAEAAKFFLASVVESSNDSVITINFDGIITSWNKAAERLHGYRQEEVVGKPLSAIVIPEDRNQFLTSIESVRSGKEVEIFQTRRFQKMGGLLWLSVQVSPIKDATGQIVGISTIARDITERREAEEALGGAVARFQSIIESAMDAVISVDSRQRVVLFNAAAEKLFGVLGSEAMGKSLDQFIPERFRGAHVGHVRTFGETGVSARRMGALLKVTGLRADGEEFPIEASISQVEVKGEKLFTVILRDITERTKAEERQGRLAAIVDSSEDAIISKNLDGFVTSWNRGAERLFGYKAEEMIGQPLTALIPVELWSEERRILERVRQGKPIEHLETVRVAKDGRRIDVSLSVSPVRNAAGVVVGASKICRDVSSQKEAEERLRRSEALYRMIARSIPEGSVTVVDPNLCFMAAEGSLLTKGNSEKMEGRTIFEVFDSEIAHTIEPRYRQALSGETTEFETEWQGHVVWAHYVPLRDESGKIIAAMSLSLDVTERKRAEQELRQAQEDLAQANVNLARVNTELERVNLELEKRVEQRTAKLNEMVGELEHFSYTITHDMRAPLRAMQGFSRLLLEESTAALDATQKGLLERIANAAARMDLLITDALNYSQAVREELTLQPVDAGALLRGIVQSYPQFEPPKAQVEIAGDIPAVLANEAGLTQCFSNLLNNAVKFVEPGKVPGVRVWAEVRSAESAERGKDEHGNYVRLWFDDKGIGISEEQQKRIFGMFQRVSKAYEGTGIGLALVRKVAERMRGKGWAWSPNRDKGAAFG